MAKNLIPEIAKMLGVELGEEFELKGYKGLVYKFIDDEFIVCDDKTTETEYTTANMTLVSLLKGTREIVKLPWKPKADDKYWTFALRYNNAASDKRTWRIVSSIWTEHPSDLALLDKGWVYKTKDEAIKALPAAAREVGAEYEFPDTEEPWKPKEDEAFYTFGVNIKDTWMVILKPCWKEKTYPVGLALYAKGWVFRTREEAEAALPKVAAEIGVEYQL